MTESSGVGAFVPLFQTGLWVLLIVGVGVALRKHVSPMIDALRKRIERGSSVKAGPFELGEDLRKLDLVKPSPGPVAQLAKPAAQDWITERDQLYNDARRVFLAHVINPSKTAGQQFDVFVYLVGHKDTGVEDVEFAEFFFGHYWGNRVFKETAKDGLVGVRTSAYGPFLCTCRVHFRDGHISSLNRYIDFEMGRVFTHAT